MEYIIMRHVPYYLNEGLLKYFFLNTFWRNILLAQKTKHAIQFTPGCVNLLCYSLACYIITSVNYHASSLGNFQVIV